MKTKLVVLMMILFNVLKNTAYAESKYPKADMQTLLKIKQKTNFKMMIPQHLPSGWTVEVKYPFPLDLSKPIHNVRFHYFNKEDAFMFGITQFKAIGHKITREEVITEPNGTQSRRSIIEEFKPDYSGEVVFINHNEGRFMPFQSKMQSGGVLWWIEIGTYINMDSMILSKKELLNIAQSMK
jgi:hypothetical protein